MLDKLYISSVLISAAVKGVTLVGMQEKVEQKGYKFKDASWFKKTGTNFIDVIGLFILGFNICSSIGYAFF